MENKSLASLNELQRELPRILDKYGSDQSVTLLALVNPLLALKEIGYTFTAEAEAQITDHIRYGKGDAERVKQLSAMIFELTGKKPHEGDATLAAAENILRTLPDNSQLKKSGATYALKLINTKPELVKGEVKDFLSDYVKEGEVIRHLVELRKLQTLNPLFDSATVFEKERITSGPLRSVRFRLNRNK